jgi:hypothetical protein
VEKIVKIARLVMGRRRVELSDAEQALLEFAARAAGQVEVLGWTVGGEREVRTAI